MDFFKSVFSDDPEPSSSRNGSDSASNSHLEEQELHGQHNRDPEPSPSTAESNPKPSIAAVANAWSFGGLIKTLASKSESVIETYRRDLEEFGSGLRKETSVIREVASRAVRDVPSSLEAGAAAAQESLETVGQAIDHIGNTVSEIIYHGTDSIIDGDSDYETSDSMQLNNNQSNSTLNSRPYSRIDAQIRAIQCDRNTYCNEPEDLEEYNEWKSEFKLDEKGGEIEDLIEENGSIEEIYNEVVPSKIDQEIFWSRYFYRVDKVKKAEEARAKLVKRAISREEEEVLSWDVDENDDDHEESDESKPKGESYKQVQEEDSSANVVEHLKAESEEKSLTSENYDEGLASESRSETGIDDRGHREASSDKLGSNSDEKLGSEGKTENGESGKDSEFSVVSSQHSEPGEEEDLGWDEIEDIGSADEGKVTASGSPNRADLRKRLSAMEEEEDLAWDIEDNDDDCEPVKS